MNASVEEVSPATKIVEVVTMTDGRKVEFAGVKRKLLKESVFNENGTINHIRLDFRNGETRNFHIPHSLLHKFAAHGAEQKLGDETAGTNDVDDMVIDIDELIERLNKGEWTTRREGGGNQGTSVLMAALMEYSKKTKDEVKAFLAGKEKKEKDALAESPKIKPIIDRLKAEKNAGKPPVDTEALLNGLA